MSRKSALSDKTFRLLVVLSIGAAAALYCRARMVATGRVRVADDFTWHWLGARALIEGQNPYEVVKAGGQYALDAPYLYPLTTAIAAVPFALWLKPIAAATVFVGLSAAILAWGLTQSGYGRLWTFLSVPFLWACVAGQWAPLVAASALVPALAWLAPVKPSLGLASIAFRPSKSAVAGSAVFVAISLLINPQWPREWIESLAHRVGGVYRMPITVGPGFLLILAVLRWRRPEARLLLIMSFVPQLFLFYDQLLLWLVPRTWRETATLSVLSFFAIVFARIGYVSSDLRHLVDAYAPVIVATIYLPCLIMILRRPNEGELPAWLNAIASRIRSRVVAT